MENNIPDLPTGNGIGALTVRSVYRRRFYDQIPECERIPHLSNQFGFLVEEIAELNHEMVARGFDGSDVPMVEEIADCFVVMFQIAWLTGGNLVVIWETREIRPRDTLLFRLGHLRKAIRNMDRDGTGPIQMSLEALAGHLHWLYPGLNRINLQEIIWRKLRADEQRGALHRGGELRDA